MSYKRPKPVKVKNVSPKIIWYGNARRKPGAIFYIEDPRHFSRRGSMVQVDENGKEIRHLGGFREEKVGEDIKWVSMKGKPVIPGDEISQPTDEELAEMKAEEEYKNKLAELNEQYRTQKAPVPAPPVNKTVAETLEEKEKKDADPNSPQPEILGSDEVATAVSNQNVI